VTRAVELRRYTANDGDELTVAGVAAAVALGTRLAGSYAVVWTSGAQRATQTAACLLAGLGETVPGGVRVAAGLRSAREDEWRTAYQRAGSGELEALRRVAPALVASEARLLGAALEAMLGELADGERGLAVGHSPTNEAAVYGLTGIVVPSLGKGAGVLVSAGASGYEVRDLGDAPASE
jgi:broad specificity phosphatase PhoE